MFILLTITFYLTLFLLSHKYDDKITNEIEELERDYAFDQKLNAIIQYHSKQIDDADAEKHKLGMTLPQLLKLNEYCEKHKMTDIEFQEHINKKKKEFWEKVSEWLNSGEDFFYTPNLSTKDESNFVRPINLPDARPRPKTPDTVREIIERNLKAGIHKGDYTLTPGYLAPGPDIKLPKRIPWGSSKRDKIISNCDILDLRISFFKNKDVNDFLKEL